MTREEAITMLKEMKSEECYKALIELCDMAISALQEPIDLKGTGTVVTMPSGYIDGDIDFHCDLKHNRMTWFNNTTESPNDVVETDDEVIEQSDLISRADAIREVEWALSSCKSWKCALMSLPSAQTKPNEDLVQRSDVLEIIREAQDGSGSTYEVLQPIFVKINALSLAEQVASKLKNPCDSLLTDSAEADKERECKLDFISRAEAVKAICNAQCELDVPHYPKCDQVKYCDDIKALLALPSADRPSGEWVNEWKDIDGGRMYGACCSVCHTIGHSGYNYCPSCGARMENEK